MASYAATLEQTLTQRWDGMRNYFFDIYAWRQFSDFVMCELVLMGADFVKTLPKMDRRGRSYKESLAEEEVKRLEKDATTVIGALLKSAGAQQKAPEPEPKKEKAVEEELVPELTTPPPVAKAEVKPGPLFHTIALPSLRIMCPFLLHSSHSRSLQLRIRSPSPPWRSPRRPLPRPLPRRRRPPPPLPRTRRPRPGSRPRRPRRRHLLRLRSWPLPRVSVSLATTSSYTPPFPATR
jgi:hypothetical protein